MSCPCTAIRPLEGLSAVGMADWATFDAAVRKVISLEGGKVHHPSDPGGRTAYGITQSAYNAWRKRMGKPIRDVFDIPEVEVRAIYYDSYWVPAGCWGMPADLAVIHFDTAVNFGVGTAQKLLAASGGTVAGYDAARRARRADIIRRKPHMKAFARGWRRRDDQVLAAATAARGSTTPPNIATNRTANATNRMATTPRPEWG